MTTTVDQGAVFTIAASVFSAMIDGDEGLLRPWTDERPLLIDPLHAWVDMHGETPGRAVLVCEMETAHDLTRALLMMERDEPVEEQDLIDAFGEIANVVGGNVKSLLPTHNTLGLPHVALESPDPVDGHLAEELVLDWRGRLVVVTIWLVA